MWVMASASRFATRYWDYSLNAYAQVDVQTLCLRLQRDYQANVNLLLLGGFAGTYGQVLAAEDWTRIKGALIPFNQRYTQRIRRVREHAQQFAGLHITARECYRQLKALELKAEQLEQQIIAVSCDNGTRSRLLRHQDCATDKQVLYNLLAYYAAWPIRSTAAAEALRELAAALIRNSEIKGNHSQR
ncbi:MAG: TIGR02444 family protein [Pseudomonadales bacterium]